MANKTTTTNNTEIKVNNRFEPRYFYNRNSLRKTFACFGYEIIENIASLISGSTPEYFNERRKESDAFFIKSADVKRYNLNRTTLNYVSEKIHKERKNKFVFPNDVLISNTGKYLGFACVVPDNIEESTTNQNVSILKLIKGTSFTSSLIVAYLNSYFGQREIESLLTLTGQKYLNSVNLKKLRVPNVDRTKARTITDLMELSNNTGTKSIKLIEQAQNIFYSHIDIDFSRIEKQNNYSVLLSNFKNADLWIPKYSYPLYVNTLKTIQAKWQTVKLGDIATFKKGDEVGSENYIGYIDKRKTDIPFIRTSDFVNYEIDQYPDFFIPEEIYKELKQDIKAGDVLFTKDGKIGMVGMITPFDKAIIASGFCILRLKKEAKIYNITPEYLFLVLSIKEMSIYASKRRTVIASTIPHLREEHLKEIEIPILEKTVIDNITELVKQAFKLKDEKKQLIKRVREIMDSCFE